MDKEKAVQGVAVYAEFARDGATTQIIVAPDGYNTDGTLVPAYIVRRTVTEHTPKKQWKFSRLPDVSGAADILADNEKAAYSDERMRYASSLFDQILRGGWSLVKRPILVEISRKDYDNIYLSKTPTKLLYRVSQSRVALDFPANLINNAA